MTEYLDDGTKIIFEYDENEELMNQTHYDTSGNVLWFFSEIKKFVASGAFLWNVGSAPDYRKEK